MRKTLNQVMPRWMIEGIFFRLKSIDNIPWGDDTDLAHRLDLVYHGNHSGDKYISPLVEKLLDDEVIKSTDAVTLANIIYDINGENWKKLWDVNTLEYNPLSNYDMIEHEYIENEGTNTGTIITDNDSTNTGTIITDNDSTNTGTVGTVGSNSNSTNVNSSNSSSGNTDTNVFGFNSDTSVGDNEVSSGATSTDASISTSNDSINSTVTNNLTSTDDTTVTNNLSSTDDTTVTNNLASTDKTDRTLTRSGNIGVTTSQQMAQSSIDLAKWKFFETVFNDIDAILTLSVY